MKSQVGIVLVVAGVLALAGALVALAWKLDADAESRLAAADKRIGEDVVATFAGGEITAQELRDYINKVVLREGEHEVCEKHGYDHSKCNKLEKCESHPLGSAESYRLLLRQLVMEKMVDRWIKEKGMLARKEVTHRLKHVVEEINLGALAGKMHSDQVKPDRVEMRQYYEEHRDEYQNRPYAEVEKEIERVLIARKQAEYVPKYIEELKKNAVIERNYEILEIPEPKEAEIKGYYESHRKEYVRPKAIRVQYVTFPIGGDERAAREKAETVLAKVRAGVDFDAAAKAAGVASSTTGYLQPNGSSGRSARFLETVFRYQPGDVTPVFKDGGVVRIARILDLAGEELKPLDAVRGEVRQAVYLANERAKLEQNKYEALFSVHGKRFTVEEFLEEFDELSPEQKRQFASFEAKCNLLDQMIVKDLLMEKAEDQGRDAQERAYLEDAKRTALEQMLHKEEVDEKISVSDAEARAFYEKYKARLVEPTKAKVSIIRVRAGFNDDERERAKQRIEEARAKLRDGADFAGVAKEYSEDWTATRGGEIDPWIYESAGHVAELADDSFRRAVFALAAGETSGSFEFRNNYWVVKVRERAEARTQTFPEAKPRIVEVLQAARHEERVLDLQNELLEKSRLVVRDFVLSRMLSAEARAHAGEERFEVR